MENKDILDKLKWKFGDSVVKDEVPDTILTVTIKSEFAISSVQFLKEQLGFEFLTTLFGIHYPEKELALGVIYQLHNMKENIRVRIKTFVPVSDPTLPTATNLFPAANWMERETYDFFGIIFKGHPNLKRILNVEYLDYFPMRKEYPLEDPTRHDKDDRFFGR